MFFRKNFPDGSMNFLNISRGENTEAQKGHRPLRIFRFWQRGGIREKWHQKSNRIRR